MKSIYKLINPYGSMIEPIDVNMQTNGYLDFSISAISNQFWLE